MDDTKDLGTYHVHVQFEDGTGFIMKWTTAARYLDGDEDFSPPGADRIPPPYSSEEDVFSTIIYAFTSGNFSCDCNERDFLDRAHQRPMKDYRCGDELTIQHLAIECPDGRRRTLLGGDQGHASDD